MRAHPLLNIDSVTLDPELLGKVPPALALYYMALPVASEDGRVSVAMAHPENTTALGVLSGLLGSPIVPVRGASGAIRSALHRLPAGQTPPSTILGWSIRPQPKCTPSPAVAAWTETLSAVLGAPATLRITPRATFDEELSALTGDRYRLTVLDLPPELLRATVLRRMSGPLFFVGSRHGADQELGTVRPLRRILVALRGYASDAHALEWATALAAEPHATLVLLPLTGGRNAALQALCAEKGDPERRCQVRACRPALDHQNTCVKLRQGTPLLRFGEEAAEGDYDLIIISAEGEGAFVAQALAELERRQAHKARPVMVIKPPL